MPIARVDVLPSERQYDTTTRVQCSHSFPADVGRYDEASKRRLDHTATLAASATRQKIRVDLNLVAVLAKLCCTRSFLVHVLE